MAFPCLPPIFSFITKAIHVAILRRTPELMDSFVPGINNLYDLFYNGRLMNNSLRVKVGREGSKIKATIQF